MRIKTHIRGLTLGCKSNVRFGIRRFLAGRRLGLTILEPPRPAKDTAIHTSTRGDSKSLPNNRTAKVHIFVNLRNPFPRQRQTFMII